MRSARRAWDFVFRHLVVLCFVLALLAATLAGYSFQRLVEEQQARNAAACLSSTELRSLLTDLKNIVAPYSSVEALPEGPRKETANRFRIRIEKYTRHNPNCEGIPLPKESK